MFIFRRLKSVLVGDTFSIKKVVTANDVQLFTRLCNDQNDLHSANSEAVIVPGALINGFVSGVIGTHLPGPGTILVRESFKFLNKLYVDDLLEIRLRIVDKRKISRIAFECHAVNRNYLVMEGVAVVLLPKNSI